MKKLGCLLTLALLWGGGQGVYEALRNRSPQEMTCEQAEKTPPSGSWLHLTGCRVNVMEAAYKTRFGVPIDDIFIPLTSAGPGKKPVRFVLATKDPEIIAVVKEMAALDEKDKGALFTFLAKNAKRLVRDKDVKGMVQSGIDKNDKVQRRLRDVNKDLVADFVVIDEGREPGFLWSAFLLTGGVVLAFLFVAGSQSKTA